MSGYGFGWRHIITFLTFIGLLTLYALRVNLSVALVAMVNQTALRISREEFYKTNNLTIVDNPCHSEDNSTQNTIKNGPFVWDENLQGVILASFFYGYIVTQVPGGILASWVGAKWVFGGGILWTALLTLLTPVAAELGSGFLITLRILEGLGEGITYPSLQILFSRWAPPSERSQLPAFASSGSLFGTLCAFMLSGVLADSDFLGGWPAIFYIFGIGGCVWFVFWAIFVSSTPETHKWISQEEKDYIVLSLEKQEEKRARIQDIPWSSVIKSLPVWAILISHFTFNWSSYVLLTGLPIYMHDVLGFDMKSNGLFSSLPYLCQGIVQMASGKVADTLRSRFRLNTTIVRKLFDCLGHLLPAVFIVTVGYVGCNSQVALAFLIIGVGLSGLCGAGYLFNFLDLAPQYSGALFGISNTIATIPGMVGPSVTGALIQGAQGQDLFDAWRNVFFIAGAFYVFSTIFYFIFAKGEEQPWAKQKSKTYGSAGVLKA